MMWSISHLRCSTIAEDFCNLSFNVTLPVEGVGAVTVVGFNVSDISAPPSCVVDEAVFDFADSSSKSNDSKLIKIC
jgi:hypothetical protein